MNRREFLKGTLGGVFGALLTWAGVVRGEEAEPTVLSDNEKRQAVEDRLVYEARAALEQMPETITADQAFDAIVDSANKWMINEDKNYLNSLSQQVAKAAAVKLDRKIMALYDGANPWQVMNVVYGDPLPNLLAWDGEAQNIKINGREQVSDNVSWDYSPETGGAPVCDMACPSWDICLLYVNPNDRPCYDTEGELPTPIPNKYMDAIDAGEGRWICWSEGGSDENGTGTYEDPVATEACAQSIAGNSQFRITAEMLTHDGITGAVLDRDGSAMVSDDMGATWREMDPEQVREWAAGRKDSPWT